MAASFYSFALRPREPKCQLHAFPAINLQKKKKKGWWMSGLFIRLCVIFPKLPGKHTLHLDVELWRLSFGLCMAHADMMSLAVLLCRILPFVDLWRVWLIQDYLLFTWLLSKNPLLIKYRESADEDWSSVYIIRWEVSDKVERWVLFE